MMYGLCWEHFRRDFYHIDTVKLLAALRSCKMFLFCFKKGIRKFLVDQVVSEPVVMLDPYMYWCVDYAD